MIQQMDQWLSSYAALAGKSFPKTNPAHAGAGAAGGLGFAFLTFFHATLESGVNIILEETHLSDYIKNADIVITGEGCLDGQTVMGKAPVGVAKIAREFQKPVLAFSGCVTEDAKACHAAGIDAFFPIVRGVISLEDAMQTDHAKQNMSRYGGTGISHASNVSEYKIMKQIGKSLFGCIFLQHFLLVYDTVAVTTLLIITDLCGIFVTVQR